MSLVKDLVDLVTQLDQSVTDRRVRDMVLPIKEKALEVQREHLAIEAKLLESERKMFQLEQQHAASITNLQDKQSQKISELHKKITELESQLGGDGPWEILS